MSAFWEWQYYLLRDWHAPTGEPSLNDTIMFAIRMATWASDGERIYVSAGRVAACARVSLRTAKEYRRRAIRLGILRETDEKEGGVRVLTIARPLHACTDRAESCTGRGAESCTQIIENNQSTHRQETVQNPARSPGVLHDRTSSSSAKPDRKGGQGKGVPTVQNPARVSVQPPAPIGRGLPPLCAECKGWNCESCLGGDCDCRCAGRLRSEAGAVPASDIPKCDGCGIAHPTQYHNCPADAA
jgi:hypothetical protein